MEIRSGNNYGVRDYSEINAVLSRMVSLLEAGDFEQADGCCDYVLHLLPGYGPAYLGKLLAEFGLKQADDLIHTEVSYTGSKNYKNALYYADPELKRFLQTAPFENYYLRAKKRMDEGKTDMDIKVAAGMFRQISGYRDADQLAKQCSESVENNRLKGLYEKAESLMGSAEDEKSWLSAADAYACLNGYLDSVEKRNICLEKAETLRKDKAYSSLPDPSECTDIEQIWELLAKYESLRGWKDSGQKAELCRNLIADYQKAASAKQRKTFLIVTAVLAVIAIGCGMVFGILPLSRYNHATDLMRKGAYSEAAEAFAALNGFMDSDNKRRECEMAVVEKQYQDALSLMTAGSFKEAADAFRALGGYKDSSEKVSEAEKQYNDSLFREAEQNVESGNYLHAVEILNGAESSDEKQALLERALSGQCMLLNRMETKEAAEELNAMQPGFAAMVSDCLEPDTIRNLRLMNSAVGDFIEFGSFEQDGDQDNGKEAIEWLVLDREDNVLTLISRYVLDAQPFHGIRTAVRWETCDLRMWLNEVFYADAFSEDEQKQVQLTVNVNSGNSESLPEADSAEDRVFLLSADEAEHYFDSNEARLAEATAYAAAHGADVEEGYASWWLRSSGYDEYNAAYVYTDGAVHRNGIYVFSDHDSVRPVIRIQP